MDSTNCDGRVNLIHFRCCFIAQHLAILYPLLDPIETAHGETEVKDDEGKSGHQHRHVARHRLGNAFHITIIDTQKKKFLVRGNQQGRDISTATSFGSSLSS